MDAQEETDTFMTGKMLIFGMGYTASRLAARLRREGWQVVGTSRTASSAAIAFEDDSAVLDALSEAPHILSSVPPVRHGGAPALDRSGPAIAAPPRRGAGSFSQRGYRDDRDGTMTAVIHARRDPTPENHCE